MVVGQRTTAVMLCCSSREKDWSRGAGDFRSGDRTNQSLAMACRGGSPPGPPSLEVESRWMEHSSVETGGDRWPLCRADTALCTPVPCQHGTVPCHAVPPCRPCRARAVSWARPAAQARHWPPGRAGTGTRPAVPCRPRAVPTAHGPHGQIYWRGQRFNNFTLESHNVTFFNPSPPNQIGWLSFVWSQGAICLNQF